MTRDEITKLSAAERLKLIEELWDSLSDADIPPLSPAQRDELLRRSETLDADAREAVTWEALKEEIRARKG
jgi:putative addiction module component (TIGR02574 family)